MTDPHPPRSGIPATPRGGWHRRWGQVVIISICKASESERAFCPAPDLHKRGSLLRWRSGKGACREGDILQS